jgi:hypothetical protein
MAHQLGDMAHQLEHTILRQEHINHNINNQVLCK